MLFKIGTSTSLNQLSLYRRSFYLTLNRTVGTQIPDNQDNYDIDESENAIRDKSKLSPHLKSVIRGDPSGLPFAFHYNISYLRRYYGVHGEASKLNPGVCYETPKELAFKSEYENLAYPPLEEALSVARAKRMAEQKVRKDREDLIEANMKKLPRLRKEMLAREAKSKAVAAEQIAKKEAVIAEIREVLGYNVNVKDPRFQEMLAKRDEEEKKKKKLARKEDKKQKLLAQLIGTAQAELNEESTTKDEASDDEETDTTKK